MIASFLRIGNQDVIDLLNSVMAQKPEAANLPGITEGKMTCERGETRAAVEWKIYSSQANAVWEWRHDAVGFSRFSVLLSAAVAAMCWHL